jgi:hypothetical protein
MMVSSQHRSSTSAPGLLYFFRIQIIVKSTLTTEKGSERLASIARRVCWWQSADSTLENTPLFVCQVMVFGTWADICFVLDHHGKAVFREALRSAPPGLFDNRSWHYWHHRLHLLPVPPPPQRAIPT